MDRYVYASALYKYMVEVGISASEREAYRAILRRKKNGTFVYPKQHEKQKMKLRPQWVKDIVFHLFDPRGKGSWSIYDYK